MKVIKNIKDKNTENIKESFFVFDTETTKLEPTPENFVFGVIYGYEFIKVIKSVDEFKTEFNRKKYENKYIFAHNAEFDLSVIYGNIYQNLDNSAIFNGKFITAKIKKTTFADSLNIYPASVKAIGEIIGLEKLTNDNIINNTLSSDNISKEDIEYCIRDCEIVYEALLKIFTYTGTIKLTLASLSLYNFRNKYLPDKIVFSELVDEFYESYYGGRTEVFKLGKTKCKVFDVNSLYPFVMKDMFFPDVKHLKKETKIDIKYFMYLLNKFEGCGKITVKHKETYFGFLPYRSDKLLFPVGTFSGVWNFNEIRFALENKAIEILSVDYAVYSIKIKSYFTDFITEHYNKRINSKDSLTKLIHKLIPNSLYGRFAMRQKYTTTYYKEIPFNKIYELQKAGSYYELKVFSVKRNDCFLVTENEKFKNSFFAIPTFSSYITSEARIYLLKHLLLNENNNVTYCDTDSIFLESDFIGEVNNKLGSFKKEDKTVIDIKGLKNYVYINDKGEEVETIKGISKRSIKLSDNSYLDTKYYKTKEALRRNKPTGKIYKQVKTLHHIYNKRIVLEDNINTKPIKL